MHGSERFAPRAMMHRIAPRAKTSPGAWLAETDDVNER